MRRRFTVLRQLVASPGLLIGASMACAYWRLRSSPEALGSYGEVMLERTSKGARIGSH